MYPFNPDIHYLAQLAHKISEASQPLPSTTPLTPTQLVEAQLPRTANLSNQIQLDQITQQYLQSQLNKYNHVTGGDTSDVRSPTSTSTEVRSPTSTSTEVRSPTSTSTDAYTQGNVTVTGGAGAGATTVYIGCFPPQSEVRADKESNMERSKGSSLRMEKMIHATSAPRVPGVMPALMDSTSAPRPKMLIHELMMSTDSPRPKMPIREMMKSTNKPKGKSKKV
jgi:hypothetical protein